MTMTFPDTYSNVLDEAIVRYSQATSLRAGIQLIPYVGGSLDTLVGGKGSKILEKRLTGFLNALSERLSQIETAANIDPNESFFDLMMITFDGVLRARSEGKRNYFANRHFTRICGCTRAA